MNPKSPTPTFEGLTPQQYVDSNSQYSPKGLLYGSHLQHALSLMDRPDKLNEYKQAVAFNIEVAAILLPKMTEGELKVFMEGRLSLQELPSKIKDKYDIELRKPTSDTALRVLEETYQLQIDRLTSKYLYKECKISRK
jgi:hypothetical protein